MIEVNITCWQCGDSLKRKFYDQSSAKHLRFFCEKCAAVEVQKKEQDDKEYHRINVSRKIDRAIEIIEGNKINPLAYKKYLEEIEEMMLEKMIQIDSSHEVVVACELSYRHVPFEFNAKVKRYRLDFKLNSEKIVLEIDGISHANKVKSDKWRDEEIISTLGKDWEIVHFPTLFVEKHLNKMMYGVSNTASKQRAIRVKHGLSAKNDFTDSIKSRNSLLYQK